MSCHSSLRRLASGIGSPFHPPLALCVCYSRYFVMGAPFGCLVLLLCATSSASAPSWVHPGVLVGPADIAAARARLAAGTEPTASFFKAAAASPQGRATYKPYGPPADGMCVTARTLCTAVPRLPPSLSL